MKVMSVFTILFTVSCGSFFQTEKLNYQNVKVEPIAIKDSSVYKMLAPYSSTINAKMNSFLAVLTAPLEKKQPNGTMGLLFTDIMRQMATEKFGMKVDAAFINNGGLRIPAIQAGDITVGKIYEVMPFDNLLVMQKVDGATLQSFLNLIAKRGGWPVSGISFDIENELATNIKIGGVALNLNNEYLIANSDYIANGGDDATMLKKVPQINKGILLRDAFIEYLRKVGSVSPVFEKRINIIK